MSDTITIQEVLARMESSSEDLEFQMSFVRANDGEGGERGSIKRVTRARKGMRQPSDPSKKASSSSAPSSSGRSKPLHKEQGTLPIVDITRDQYITPLTSHIIGFNGLKVIH